MLYYLPSCNFTKACPEESLALHAYMRSRGASIPGCCRLMTGHFTAEDTVVTICQSCGIITRETSPETHVISLWEYLAADESFPWPDHSGECITLQDCFRARNDALQRSAVRTCLSRMHLTIVEAAGNGDGCSFDGTWLYAPVAKQNLKVAPVFFGDIRITPVPREQWQSRMQAYAAAYTTDRVCVYCNACLAGLRLGGADALHLATLLLPIISIK